MLKSSALLLLAASVALSPLYGEDAPARERNARTEQFNFKENFQEEFHNLFEMLAVEYPQFNRKLTPLDAEKALAAVMDSLNSGIAIQKNGEKNLPVSPGKPTPNKPVLHSNNGLSYLRMDSLEKKDIPVLLQLLSSNAKGIILDLRSCSSGDGNELARKLSRFLTEKKNANLPHAALLTSRETAGAAEILAAMLTQAGKGIRIGEATAGKPFPRKTIAVSTVHWLVPVPPKDAENLNYVKLQPQIVIPAGLRTPYEKIKKEDFADSGDRCLSRAADLLISLNLLDKKGLKK